MKPPAILPLALALSLPLVGPMSATRADSFRVKTGRGSYLVEVDAPDVTVRGDGDDLVVSRSQGDEVRLKLGVDRADRNSREPALVLRREGKVIVTARRVSSGPSTPFEDGPGRTVLGSGSTWTAWSVAITPDGKTLVSGHQGFLRVWDMATRSERYNVPTGRTVRRVAVTPDGSTIASAEYQQGGGKTTGTVVIRDGKTGRTLRESKPFESGLHGVAIDPTGKVVVSSSWSESDIRVWDAETAEQVGTLKGHTGAVTTLAYSPDGKTLASAGDTTVRLWDVDTGAVRLILRGHQKGVESVAFSADGKVVASGSFDNTARAWDAASGKLLATFPQDQPVLAVAVSPDGKAVASASARWGSGFYNQAPAEVQLWDVAGSRSLATLPDQPNQVFAMTFTPDGKSLITASLSGALTLWDLATFREPVAGTPAASPPDR
jgi:WD40 repeat protein